MVVRVLVLGIGNTLLSDEGVGVVAMRALQARLPDDEAIEFLDGGTLSFTLAVPIAECDALLVFDAAMTGGATGSVLCVEGAAMDRFLGENRKASVHEVGLIDLMSISMLSEKWPAHRALIGVQPQKLDWGDELTAPVAAALPHMCDLAEQLIVRWRWKPTPQ